MQRFFNTLSVASFVMSTGFVVGTVVIYTRIPSITKHYIGEIKLELTQAISEIVPRQIDQVMPELPTQTGPALPIKPTF